MKKRAFWIASFVFALTAVFFHWAALAKAANGVQSFNKSGDLNVPEQQRQIFAGQAHHFYHIANNLRYVGVAVAVLGVICLFISRQKGEPTLRWATIIVLAFYLMLQLAVV